MSVLSGEYGVSGQVPEAWRPLESGPRHGAWLTPASDLIVIDHVPARALVGPFLLDDYRHDLRLTAGAQRGGLIECELHDRLGVVGITKEPRPDGAGVTVRGYALAPTAGGHLAISLLASERADPGAREAQVLRDSGRIPLDWLGDPYGYEYDSTADAVPAYASHSQLPHPEDPWAGDMFVRNTSDSARFDSAFPRHPLTRARRHLTELGRRLSLTAPSPESQLEARACGLEFTIPLGYLPVAADAWGASFRRVSFSGRLQLLTITRRPAACATEPGAVAYELERARRAGRVEILRGATCARRRLGDFDGLYAEHETRVGHRELYTAAFYLRVGGGTLEVALSAGRDDWLRANRDLDLTVAEARPTVAAQGAELSDAALERIYRLLVRLAYCDGQVDPSERDVLDAFRIKHDLDPDLGDALERNSAQSDRHNLGADPAERSVLLRAMIEVAVADGVLDPSELARLRAVARAMGVPEAELMRRIQDRMA